MSVNLDYSDIDSIKKLIPDNSRLAVSPDLTLHFANRAHLYTADNFNLVDYVVVHNKNRPEFLYNIDFKKYFSDHLSAFKLISQKGELLLYGRIR